MHEFLIVAEATNRGNTLQVTYLALSLNLKPQIKTFKNCSNWKSPLSEKIQTKTQYLHQRSKLGINFFKKDKTRN